MLVVVVFKLASFTLTNTTSPPPLTTASSSPVGSSASVDSPQPTGHERALREDDPSFFNWHKRAAVDTRAIVGDDFSSDDVLFPHDDDDYDLQTDLPLFPAASTLPQIHEMPAASAAASPIDIATSRQSSSSPRNQQSNLTTQIRESNSQERNDSNMMPAPDRNLDGKARQESVSLLGTTPYGARQIPSANGLNRRESAYGLSGSVMGGMSWGGISMGSFIRDE